MSPTTIPGTFILQSPASNDPLLDLNTQPSLDLQFATGKTLDDRVSGNNLITFSRASTGTYVGSDGLIKTAVADEPRFGHDPVTGESLGLLIEEARTNLLTYSIDFSYWFNVTGGSGITPVRTPNLSGGQDGTATVTKLEFDVTGGSTGGDVSMVGLSYTSTGGVSYTLSAWIRADSTFNINFACDTGTTNEEEVTTEWKRVTYTTNSGGAGSRQVRIGLRADQNVPDTATIYIWGAQLEANASFPTSYIPTSGSTVTRAADVAEITGTNFSSWYNQSEGTVFVDASAANAAINQYMFHTYGASANNNRSAYYLNSSNRPSAAWINSGTTQALLQSATPVSGFEGAAFKYVAAYNTNDFVVGYNGGSLIFLTSGTPDPTINVGGIGSFAGTIYFLNGHIARLTYYPYRLADATLQEITS